MQIVVSEMPIEDAVERARQRFARADQRLAEALANGHSTLPWLLGGVLAVTVATLGLAGVVTLPAGAGPAMAALPALGGAALGYAVPQWLRARAERKRHTREWQHALELLRLREQQAEADAALTVEVLDRVECRDPLLASKWRARVRATSRYVQ